MDFNLTHIVNEEIKTSVKSDIEYYGRLDKFENGKTSQYALKQHMIKRIGEPYAMPVWDSGGVSRALTISSDGMVYMNTKDRILKQDSLGRTLWSINFQELGGISNVGALNTDAFGNLYVGGANGISPAILIKLDTDGNELWRLIMDNDGSFNRVISILVRGNYIYTLNRNNRIAKWHDSDLSGNTIPTKVWEFKDTSNPVTFAVDDSGVYVGLKLFTNPIVKYNENGASVSNPPTIVKTIATGVGTAVSDLFTHNDFLYVVQQSVVQKIDTTSYKVIDSLPISNPPSYLSIRESGSNLVLSGDKLLTVIDLDAMKVKYKLYTGDRAACVGVNNSTIYKYNFNGTLQKLSLELSKIEHTIVKDTPLNISDELDIYDSYNGYTPISMLNNHIFAKKGNSYYILEDGWDSPGTKVDMPFIGEPQWALFVEVRYGWWEPEMYRLIVYDKQSEKLYHNQPVLGQINTWNESNVWGLPNTHNPIDNATTIYKDKVRPKFYIPPTADNIFDFLGGSQYRRKSAIGMYDFTEQLYFATYSQTATPMSVFETKDGKDIYVQYQYGVYPSSNRYGQYVNFSNIASFPAGTKIRKRTSIIPNKDNKEPIDIFSYGLEVSVTGLSHSGGKTKITAPGHGLASTDIIHFKNESISDNTNNWITPQFTGDILNNNVNTKWLSGNEPPMGNGKIYMVEVIDGNNFYIREAVGNPHNHLIAWHIHSIDVVPGGLVISTGEAGLGSNFTYLFNPKFTDHQSNVMIQADYAQLHLTANPETNINASIQRGLGFYMEEDYFIFASDEETYYRNSDLPDGRTDKVSFQSPGVYKGTLSQIDNWKSLRMVLQPNYVTFLFKKIGDIFITSDVSGATYYSIDKGESWKYLYTFRMSAPTMFSGMSRDRKEFIVGGYYFRMK